MWQVVEKESFGTDWRAVRYHDRSMQRFSSAEEAAKAAQDYLTDVNCNNALTKDEKISGVEAFMMTEDGCLLGKLDGQIWFMTYPKDIKAKDSNGKNKVVHTKGEVVKDRKFFLLEGKTEVAVRRVPGT